MEPRNTHLYELPLLNDIVHLLNSLWLKWPQASISALFLLHCLLWALTLDCILELYAPKLCCMIRCCQNDKELLEWPDSLLQKCRYLYSSLPYWNMWILCILGIQWIRCTFRRNYFTDRATARLCTVWYKYSFIYCKKTISSGLNPSTENRSCH